MKEILSATSRSERCLKKRMLREILRMYAQYFPEHWKKEGLIIKLSELLGLDEKLIVPSHLWFGSWVLCLMSDFFQRRIYYFGSHERKTENLIFRLTWQGANVLDIGANIGVYTMLAAKNARGSGKVISLEPVPQMFQQLSEGVRLNGYTNVLVYNIAAWEQNRQLKMVCSEPQNLGSYGVDIKEHKQSGISVQAVRIDDLAVQLGLQTVDLIKIDVEGAELQVLKGTIETLRRHRPILVLEIDPILMSKYDYSPEDVWRYLRVLDYECYAVGESGRFYREDKYRPVLRPLGPTTRDNYIFIPKGVTLA
jgi:FkbM family methyltransferase